MHPTKFEGILETIVERLFREHPLLHVNPSVNNEN